MNFVVIDASVAAKSLFLEDGTELVHSFLNTIDYLIEPDLFEIELDAIITKRVRKKFLTVQEGDEKRIESRSFKHTLVRYNEIAESAFEISSKLPVTLYDATYVATAILANSVFYTADERLVRGLSTTKLSKYVKSVYG
jgi:predicted nucleic acid-binding protein